MSDKPTRAATAGPATVGVIAAPKSGGKLDDGYVPTDADRAKVRSLAKAFPAHSEHLLARMMGMSRRTLRTYFRADLEMGRAELVVACASQLIALAQDKSAREPQEGLDGKMRPPVAKGDQRAMEFVLMRMGGWGQTQSAGDQDDDPQSQVYDFDVSAIPRDIRRVLLQQVTVLIEQREGTDGGGSQRA